MTKPVQTLEQSVLQSAVGQLSLLSLSCHFWHLAAKASMPSICHGLAYQRASSPLHSQNAQELRILGWDLAVLCSVIAVLHHLKRFVLLLVGDPWTSCPTLCIPRENIGIHSVSDTTACAYFVAGNKEDTWSLEITLFFHTHITFFTFHGESPGLPVFTFIFPLTCFTLIG